MATCLLNTSKWIGYRRSWPMSALAGSFSHASVFSRQTESSRTPASLTEFVRDPDCDPDRRYLPVAVRLARHRRLGDDCPNRLAPAALRAPWLDVGAQWGHHSDSPKLPPWSLHATYGQIDSRSEAGKQGKKAL